MSWHTGKMLAAAVATLLVMTAGAVGLPGNALSATAAEPVNVAAASGENAPALEVSYVTGWNASAALNNGKSAATNAYTEMWGTWGAPDNPAQDTASYTWEKPVTVSSSKLYLWQNHISGDSGVMIPQAWSIQYKNAAGEWTPVALTDPGYPLPVLDEAAPVSSLPVVQASFTPVTTTGVRLTLDRAVVGDERKATSVIEWEVWGTPAGTTEPEPENPDAFLEAEPVAVRTLSGSEPKLPARAWVIDENGPLHYVDVAWPAIAEGDVAEPGIFEIEGDPAGYDGQVIEATIYVADELSEVIESVDYAVSITTPGVLPVLPDTVAATFADDTRSSSVGVAWAAIDADAYAEVDAIFDVAGVVAGYSAGTIATVFVVERVDETTPIVTVSLDSEPPGTGWYTSAPTVSVSAELTSAAIKSIEYSLDGDTWQAYTSPFAVSAQGELLVSARATSEDGQVGETSRAIKVDTMSPDTGIDWVVVDGSSATVTLSPVDAQPGSGVSRTVWSDGPDASPTGEENGFYATYEEPFSVQLTAEPRYVHVQAQDAAGNAEAYKSVELPRLEGNTLDLVGAVTPRCVAGKVYLYVSLRNSDDIAASVSIATPYGSKTFAALAPEKAAAAAFAARTPVSVAGVAVITGTASDGSAHTGSVSYPAHTCGAF